MQALERRLRETWLSLRQATGADHHPDYVVVLHPIARRSIVAYLYPIAGTTTTDDVATFLGFEVAEWLQMPRKDAMLMRREEWEAIKGEWTT